MNDYGKYKSLAINIPLVNVYTKVMIIGEVKKIIIMIH